MSISEVAKLAGVSNATISRVINHRSSVSESTAANVRRAMRELGYKPSINRRGPKLGPRKSASVTNVLFLVFIEDQGSNNTTGFQRLLASVSSQFEDQNVNLTAKFISSPDELSSLSLTSPKVDGILAHGSFPFGVEHQALHEIPTVWLMGNPIRPSWGDQVMPCNDEIGILAANYLVGQGHSQLAYLNLLPNHWALQLHGKAFQQAAQEIGGRVFSIEPKSQITHQHFIDFNPSSSAQITDAADHMVDELLQLNSAIQGAFIAEDAQAAILVPALQRRGFDLTPNGNLAVLSCNNERPYLVGLNPCPPTIDIRIETIGRRGAAQLLWRIAEGSLEDRIVTTVDPQLIVSDSIE